MAYARGLEGMDPNASRCAAGSERYRAGRCMDFDESGPTANETGRDGD